MERMEDMYGAADVQRSEYPSRAHIHRTLHHLSSPRHGIILLAARASATYDDSDMPPPFRQRRYFYYLTGATEADLWFSYDIRVDRVTLWVPRQRSPRQILYMGKVITREEAEKKYDVDEARGVEELEDWLVDEVLARKKTLYVLHGSADGETAALCARTLGGEGRGAHIDTSSLLPAINAARVIKDSHEIAATRRANEITTRAHVEVLRRIRHLQSEAAVEGIYRGVCVTLGGREQAYAPIVASGRNAATLHYTRNDELLRGRQVLLLDAGCEYQNYSSDVTRSFPLSGRWPTREAREIYDLVEEMQEACIARVAPGVLFRDLNVLAHYIMVRGLLALGILRNGSVDEIVRNGTSAAFLPHGLGHHMGLEVHDVEDATHPMSALGSFIEDAEDEPATRAFALLAPAHAPDAAHPFAGSVPAAHGLSSLLFAHTYGALSSALTHPSRTLSLSTRGLRAGMVVTIEPGVYFNAYGLHNIYLRDSRHARYIDEEVLGRYMDVGGVRIEDDILVTEGGFENLTGTPKGEAALRIIRGEE